MYKISSREEFYQVIGKNGLMIITLGSNSCGHCREFQETLSKLYPYIPVSKVVTDEVGGLARELGAEFMPYTAFYKNGEVLYKFYGKKTIDELLSKINELQ